MKYIFLVSKVMTTGVIVNKNFLGGGSFIIQISLAKVTINISIYI